MPDANVPAPDISAAIHNAFMLGWEIVELKNRLQVALIEHFGSSMRLASVWRAIFNRIAALQQTAFPNSADTQTLYEPPPKESLPYLYPPEPDYANVGILGTNAAGVAILGNFTLYEVTRRAINCLTLLYINLDESLIPDMIVKDQKRLISEILKATQNPGGGGGVVEAPADAVVSQDDLQRAKEALTERITKFLNAWDGYLRENYYVGGQIPNNDLELIAYEAGNAMSSLCWGISSATIALEQTVEAVRASPETPDAAQQLAQTEQKLVAAWQTVFRDQDVIRLQHQISALSSALDDAYYLQHKDLKRPDDTSVLVAPNPDLPSQAIGAVKHSLDYWQSAVDWVAANTSNRRALPGTTVVLGDWSQPMRSALIEQSDIWQTLMTGQQSLRAYNMESVTQKLMQDVTAEIQRSLQTNFKAGIQKAEQAMKEVAKEAKGAIEAMGQLATESLETLFQSFARLFWPILSVVALVSVVLVVAYFAFPHNGAGATSGGAGIVGLLTAIAGSLGLTNANTKKAEQKTALQSKQTEAKTGVDTSATAAGTTAAAPAGTGSLLTSLEGAAQDTGKMVLQALERGYEQMRIVLDSLNRSVAVTYPLVEFCGEYFTLKSDADFLTAVIWSGPERAEEIKQVLRAAFGPLATFLPESPIET